VDASTQQLGLPQLGRQDASQHVHLLMDACTQQLGTRRVGFGLNLRNLGLGRRQFQSERRQLSTRRRKL
jgi:hypothetical protein